MRNPRSAIRSPYQPTVIPAKAGTQPNEKVPQGQSQSRTETLHPQLSSPGYFDGLPELPQTHRQCSAQAIGAARPHLWKCAPLRGFGGGVKGASHHLKQYAQACQITLNEMNSGEFRYRKEVYKRIHMLERGNYASQLGQRMVQRR
jgi:hypothetical protein